jgi:hypothetical protein
MTRIELASVYGIFSRLSCFCIYFLSTHTNSEGRVLLHKHDASVDYVSYIV